MSKTIDNQKGRQAATLKKVLRYISKYWFMVGLSIILAVAVVVLTLYVPILTGDAVDLLLGQGLVDMPAIFHILKKIAIAVLLTAVAQWVMNTCNNFIT